MRTSLFSLLAALALLLSGCPVADDDDTDDDDSADDDAGDDDAGDDDAGDDDAGDDDAADDDTADDDTGDDDVSADPLIFNIILIQTVQACGGCGIWFDWQGVEEDKPRLVIEYDDGAGAQTATYRHGLNGMDNAHGFFLSAANEGEKHSILVKQTPHRNGLFWVDASDVPPSATIVQATLHLHIHTGEGLANSDNESVLAVHECARPWDWDHATWAEADAGQAWTQAGGDVGAFIREIRAYEDLHALGFSKANPDAWFDITGYVQQLQAAR